MNVQREKAKIRNRAPSIRQKTDGAITQRQLAQSGGVALDAINIDPRQVSPGGSIEVEVSVYEDIEYVGVGPELCAPVDVGFGTGSGISVDVEVNPSWTNSVSDNYCIPVSSFGQNDRNETYAFLAPQLPDDVETEDHTVEVTIQVPGNDAASASRGVTVQQDGFTDPSDPGSGGDDGGGGPGSARILELLLENLPLLVVVFVVLYILSVLPN